MSCIKSVGAKIVITPYEINVTGLTGCFKSISFTNLSQNRHFNAATLTHISLRLRKGIVLHAA